MPEKAVWSLAPNKDNLREVTSRIKHLSDRKQEGVDWL
jgi:hypothetical protein